MKNKQEITVDEILSIVDTYSNLDDCYNELKEALQELEWFLIIKKTNNENN